MINLKKIIQTSILSGFLVFGACASHKLYTNHMTKQAFRDANCKFLMGKVLSEMKLHPLVSSYSDENGTIYIYDGELNGANNSYIVHFTDYPIEDSISIYDKLSGSRVVNEEIITFGAYIGKDDKTYRLKNTSPKNLDEMIEFLLQLKEDENKYKN